MILVHMRTVKVSNILLFINDYNIGAILSAKSLKSKHSATNSANYMLFMI